MFTRPSVRTPLRSLTGRRLAWLGSAALVGGLLIGPAVMPAIAAPGAIWTSDSTGQVLAVDGGLVMM